MSVKQTSYGIIPLPAGLSQEQTVQTVNDRLRQIQSALESITPAASATPAAASLGSATPSSQPLVFTGIPQFVIVGTPAAGAGTLTNLPSGKSGNPAVWLEVYDSTGTLRYVPAW